MICHPYVLDDDTLKHLHEDVYHRHYHRPNSGFFNELLFNNEINFG